MTEILFENIGKYRIIELSDYFFNTTDLTRRISEKQIKDVDIFDLLHLIRRRNFTEIATDLAIKEFQEKGFNGYSFNYDEKSIAEQDLLKELVLLDEEFWQYNQDSHSHLKPIIEKNGCYLNLSNKFIQPFLEVYPKKIIWSKEEIERIKSLVEMDAASTVHSAWEMIRRLKRAIDKEIEVEFKWKDNTYNIVTVEDLADKIIIHLPYQNDFKKVLKNEIKIKKTATNF